MNAVLDFTSARQRLEARAEHAIEFTPRATLIERMAARMTDAQLAELIHVTLEECK
jgi:hypothetical protein